ncbi:MAG TPA: GntR family transcriptional regulator, partial [Clostridiales bacterium]|nr:GntR family transcriptional regulator [Clostridiales bacterium]
GFDNLEICCQLTPQLTTIAQDLRKKAELTVDILFRRLRAPDSPFESRILDVSLVERNSVQSRPCPIP